MAARRDLEYPQVSAERVLVGHCPNPECTGPPIVVLNNRESWPLITCPSCDEVFDTLALRNRVRYERGWLLQYGDGVTMQARPV